MGQLSQASIDDLLEDDLSHEKLESMVGQDSELSGTNQAQVSDSGQQVSAKFPGLGPWPDFMPESEKAIPLNLVGELEHFIDRTNDTLKDKELFKLDYLVESAVHRSYYELWMRDSNKLFRSLCRLRGRLVSVVEKKPISET